ncbi:hypothetical protein CEE39_01945 [bacterium (candidate division B38) B3_B38]|nr:MAG: hypothetical protein CEE39_01945 [bacterium (candidate division B38) B3_B38]
MDISCILAPYGETHCSIYKLHSFLKSTLFYPIFPPIASCQPGIIPTAIFRFSTLGKSKAESSEPLIS